MATITDTTGQKAPEVLQIDPAAKAAEYQKWASSYGDDYIGKGAKNKWNASYDERFKQSARDREAFDYGNRDTAGKLQTIGTPAEQAAQLAGLELGKVGYGQNLFETGSDIQRVKELQRARTEQSGGDPVSAAIMAQKAGAEANARRQMQGSGVKGGAAAGAVEAVSRARQSDIDASLYGQQRQSIADERSLASNMLSGQTSLMQGERGVGTSAGMPSAPKASGLMDSVICTELHSQGIMANELYLKDCEYGLILKATMPHTIIGYHFWAKPVVKLMKKSKLFTKIISYPAMKWAKHIAGEESSAVGYVCQNIGEPLCNLLGRIITLSYGVIYGV